MTTTKKEIKIMIVDDSPEMIDVLDNMLPDHIKRQVALNGPSALKLLDNSNNLPDLILLDVIMPTMSGFEVCEKIKENNRLSHIPIIFISSLNDTFDKVKGFSLGAVDYITKPFQKEEVLLRINTHFNVARSKRKYEELYSKTIRGTVQAMNDILSIVNPEISKISNSMELYSEKLAKELSIEDSWDLNIACNLFGLGMLSNDIEVTNNDSKEVSTSNEEDNYEEINAVYKSLSLSKDIISNIPNMESVTEIMEISLTPIHLRYKFLPITDLDPTVLKGHILRTLIFYLYSLDKEENGLDLISEMKKSKNDYYSTEILSALYKVQTDLLMGEIVETNIYDLKPNMILAANLYYSNGTLMLKSGSKLSMGNILLIRSLDDLKNNSVMVIKD